jgi:hypothetical protein
VFVPSGFETRDGGADRLAADALADLASHTVALLAGGTVIVRGSTARRARTAEGTPNDRRDLVSDLKTPEELTAAVRACHDVCRSIGDWSAGERAESRRIGILIQRQIDPAMSGTIRRISADAGGAAGYDITHTTGAIDAMAAGWIEPVRFRIEDRNLDVAGQWADLVRHARRADAAMGAPHELEWAIDRQGALWILACRPVPPEAARTAARAGRRPGWFRVPGVRVVYRRPRFFAPAPVGVATA